MTTTEIGDLLERVAHPQVGLGENQRIPRDMLVLFLLEEVEPEAIIGNEISPVFANKAQFRNVFRIEKLENKHEDIERYVIECAGPRLNHHRPIRRLGGRLRTVGNRFPKLSQQRTHGLPVSAARSEQSSVFAVNQHFSEFNFNFREMMCSSGKIKKFGSSEILM